MTLTIKDFLTHSFVISIYDKKYDEFTKNFRKAGLDCPLPTKFTGIQLKRQATADFEIKNNILNCTLSHMTCIQIAKHNNYPYVVVFEDDAYPCKNIVSKLTAILSNIPDDIDVIKLGWNNIYKQQDFQSGSFDIKYTWGAHSYIVFKRYYDMYQALLQQNPIADTSVLNNNSSKILSTREMMFVQHDAFRDIGQLHAFKDKSYFENKKICLSTFDCF